VSVTLIAQQAPLDPASILKIPTDSWPTYHGDYSGRRFSTLMQITSDNVKNLALAWVYRLNTSQALANIGGEGPDVPPAAANGFGTPTIKATPLMVNGVLYFSSPDHVWAVDRGPGANSGTTSGRRAAAFTSAIAASGCTATGFIS